MGPTRLLTLAKLRMPASESAAVRLWGISFIVERETAQNDFKDCQELAFLGVFSQVNPGPDADRH